MLATLFDLPLGGPPQADPLVRRGHRRPGRRHRRHRGAAAGRAAWSAWPTSPSCGTSGSTPRPGGDLISMLAHGEATRNMAPREYFGNVILLIVGGNDTTRNSITGGGAGAEPEPGPVRQAARQPVADPHDGLRDHPLADAAGPHAPHGDGGLRAGGQDHPQGRQGRHVVRLGQPRRQRHRQPERLHHRPRPAAPATCRSASASTAAWATAWPSCS